MDLISHVLNKILIVNIIWILILVEFNKIKRTWRETEGIIEFK